MDCGVPMSYAVRAMGHPSLRTLGPRLVPRHMDVNSVETKSRSTRGCGLVDSSWLSLREDVTDHHSNIH
jgi:hypothetical protein